jgi:hypothetical protein
MEKFLKTFCFEGDAWAFTPSELTDMIMWVDGIKEMASRDLQSIPPSEGGGFTKEQLDDHNELQDLMVPHLGEWWNVPQEISEHLDQQEMFDDYMKFEQIQAKEHLLRHHSNVVDESILTPSEGLFIPYNMTCGNTYIVCELKDVECFLISAQEGRDAYCIGVTEYGTVWIPPKMKKCIIAAQSKYLPEDLRSLVKRISLDSKRTFFISMRAVGGSANPWKATWINL